MKKKIEPVIGSYVSANEHVNNKPIEGIVVGIVNAATWRPNYLIEVAKLNNTFYAFSGVEASRKNIKGFFAISEQLPLDTEIDKNKHYCWSIKIVKVIKNSKREIEKLIKALEL